MHVRFEESAMGYWYAQISLLDEISYGTKLSEFIASLQEAAKLLGADDPKIVLEYPEYAEHDMQFYVERTVNEQEMTKLKQEKQERSLADKRRLFELLKKELEAADSTTAHQERPE